MSKKKSNSKKDVEPKKPKVHKELEGFEIKVNPLGEISSSLSIDELNQFLNRQVRDKKLVGRKDLGFEPVDYPKGSPEAAKASAGGDDDDEDYGTDDFGIDEDDMDGLDSTEGPDEDLGLDDDVDDIDIADDADLQDEFDEDEDDRR